MAGYGDDTGFHNWLSANGYTLPGGAPSPDVLRQRGSAWLDSIYGPRFKGTPADGVSQERAWPRTGAVVYGETISDDIVPLAVINASYLAAWSEASDEGSLSGGVTSSTGQIKREKVGPLETEYFSAKDTMKSDGPYDPLATPAGAPIILAIDQLLKPYLVLADFGAGIWSVGPTSDC